MSDITLFGHPDSGHACKVALALHLAQIEHNTVWVDIWADPSTRHAAFLAASPLAEVPLLNIDGTSYMQSGAILLQIAARFGVLGGESETGLQRARELLMWEGNRLGMCVPQLKEAKRTGGAGFPDGAIEWLKARFDIDRQNFAKLLGDAPFFHGDTPGIGDCAIWGYGQWINDAGLDYTPLMSAWVDRMAALPQMKTPADFFPKS